MKTFKRFIHRAAASAVAIVTTGALAAPVAGADVVGPATPTLKGLGNAQTTLNTIINWAEAASAIVILLAFIVGTGLMAWGSHSRSPQNAERGKTTLVIAFCAAVLLAMGTVIINAAWNLGAGT